MYIYSELVNESYQEKASGAYKFFNDFMNSRGVSNKNYRDYNIDLDSNQGMFIIFMWDGTDVKPWELVSTFEKHFNDCEGSIYKGQGKDPAWDNEVIIHFSYISNNEDYKPIYTVRMDDSYMNSFNNYSAAARLADQLSRRYKGKNIEVIDDSVSDIPEDDREFLNGEFNKDNVELCPECESELEFIGYQGNDAELKCSECGMYFYKKDEIN